MAISVYTGAGGGVSSFNGRTGAVVPAEGDYTKAQIGLGNVDNTSDAMKPISNATKTALDEKQNKSKLFDITLLSSGWSNNSYPLTGIECTENTKVDITCNETMYTTIKNQKIEYLAVHNNDGILTVISSPVSPQVDLSIQITCSEVLPSAST